MEEFAIHLDFHATKSGSTKGTVDAKKGDQILHMDSIDIAKEKARQGFVNQLLTKHEGLTKKHEADIYRQLLDLAARQFTQQREADNSGPEDDPRKNQPLILSSEKLKQTDKNLIASAEAFLLLPDLIVRVVENVHELGVAGENELIVTLYVIGTSRLLSRPLAGLVMAPSSAGKSFVINRVADLFPKETVLQAHRMTPRALEHMPSGHLIHRFIVGGERSRVQDDGAAEATRALREMISDGKLTLLTTVRRASREFETVHIQQDGPIAYVESTTLGIRDIFDEDRTRFILLASDESQHQTDSVLKELARQAEKPSNPDRPDSIIALHHTTQRLLKPYDVEIPYAGQLIDSLPAHRLEVRRTFGHLLRFIEAVTLLYQYQRTRTDEGRLIATPEDYDVVREHLSGPLARSLGCSLTPGATQLLEIARPCSPFTVGSLAAKTHCSESTVRGRIKELVSAGQCEIVEKARGRDPAIYKVADDPPPMSGLVLPDLSPVGSEKNLVIVP